MKSHFVALNNKSVQALLLFENQLIYHSPPLKPIICWQSRLLSRSLAAGRGSHTTCSQLTVVQRYADFNSNMGNVII